MINEDITQFIENDTYGSYVKFIIDKPKLKTNNVVLILESQKFKLSIIDSWIILCAVVLTDNNRSVKYAEMHVIKRVDKEYKETYNYVLGKIEDKVNLSIEDITQNYFTYMD